MQCFHFFFRQHFSNLCICIETQLLNENSNLLRHFCNALEKRSRLSLFQKLIGECRRVNNLYFLIIFTTKYRKPRYTNNLARHRDLFFFFFNIFSFTHQRIFLQTYTKFFKVFFLSFKYIYQLTL